jgi:hypothetical protein
MSIQIIIDWVFVIGCAGLIVAPFPPFERKRDRTRWAKVLLVCIGILGFAKGVACLSLDAGWYVFSESHRYLIDDTFRLVYDGLALGAFFALILSGQMRGTKRDL